MMKDNLIFRITTIICMTLVAIVALIGGFWGAVGFQYIGIGIAIGICGLLFIGMSFIENT